MVDYYHNLVFALLQSILGACHCVAAAQRDRIEACLQQRASGCRCHLIRILYLTTMAAEYTRPPAVGPWSPERWPPRHISTVFFSANCPSEKALQKLLENPIQFVPTTILTFKDEANMAPVLRPRKHLNESQAQHLNRMNVRRSILPPLL